MSDDRPVMTVSVGQTVRLDGTASWDPNFQIGAALTYAWTLVQRPAGSAAAIAAPTLCTADVRRRRGGCLRRAPGRHVRRALERAARDTDHDRQQPAGADPGPTQTVAVGGTVTLNGTGSTTSMAIR